VSERVRIGPLAYGALFAIGLPAALIAWADGLDRLTSLPALGSPAAGAIVAGLGALLAGAGVVALWRHGAGLPMSPYPPRRHVRASVYAFLRHPIYAGVVLMSIGVALAARSGAGLFIVSPALAAAAAAWVLGYERDATRARFPEAGRPPVLRLPADEAAAPALSERLSAWLLVLVPWAVLYQAIEMLGAPPGARVAWRSWDARIPVWPWTEAIYALAYPLVLAAPFAAATRRDLRWFMTRGWLATAIILPVYLLFPVIAPARPVVGDGVFQSLMRAERWYDAPITAFPAFHVAWAFVAATVLARRRRGGGRLWYVLAAAISVSCTTTGMHATADVVAGAFAFALVSSAERVWDAIRRMAERLANSWSAVQVGPVRLINHGLYAAAGTWIGMYLIVGHAGAGAAPAAFAAAAAIILGAAAWAQAVEGSPALLRPYGYYGGVLGASAALVVAGAIGADAWRLAAALAIGGSVAQAIGRLRCLVQGCCHGAPCAAWLGIVCTNPNSRVTRLSGLGGRPLHPTPLYAAGWLLLTAAALARLAALGASLQLIAGFYLVLTGIGRFVEEHYRGEPQTARVAGLPVYQWLAIASVVAGGVVSAWPGPRPAPPFAAPSAGALAACTAFAAGAYVAYGVDFPGLQARFSRLA
jgi:protein-S-isoprenylcysteine O-methyltransferase Ste14